MGNRFTAISNVYNEPEEEPMILDTEEVSPGDVDIATVNLCQRLKNHIDTIVPLESDSASATDTYVLNVKNLHFKNKPIHQGFIKMFIVSPNRRELEYEMNVYNITNRLIDLKINPGYSYVYNEAKNCTYQNILDLLKGQKFINKGVEVTFNDTELEQKFQRNMLYIDDYTSYVETLQSELSEYRPALYVDSPPGFTFRLKYPLSDYKFSYSFMESHSTKKVLKNFMRDELKYRPSDDEAIIREYKKLGVEQDKLVSLVKEGFEWNNIFRVKMLQIFFLICTALYAFSLSGCVHNDLHSGNIYVETLNQQEQSIFCINNKYYSIKSQYKVYIYDFDRSYAKQLPKNQVLESKLCDAFQCNEWYDNLDIVKILCYMVRDYKVETSTRLLTSFADEMINCIIPPHESDIRHLIYESYTKGVFVYASNKMNGCFFENITKDKKEDFFKRCYNMTTIIDNIYGKFFRSDRPVKVQNRNAFNLYVCDADYFDTTGKIKDERFVQEQYEKIRNTLLGIKTTARIRGRTEYEEKEKSGEEEKSGEVEEQRRKRSRRDGRRSRPMRQKSPSRRKSPKK